jgi:tRNA threonylcarbamoyladenosine biosynthesis protein TsaB
MRLFLDALSFPAYAALFDDGRSVVAERRFDIDGRENDALLDELQRLLDAGGATWQKLAGIVVVVGPGGFTGTRLVTLMANAVGWALGTPLVGIDAFGLCALSGAPLPHFSRANRNEYLVRETPGEVPRLLRAGQLAPGAWTGPANPLDFTPGTVIISGIDYAAAIRNLDLSTHQERLIPSYAKAPNIS